MRREIEIIFLKSKQDFQNSKYNICNKKKKKNGWGYYQLDTAEEKTSKLEDRAIQIIQADTQSGEETNLNYSWSFQHSFLNISQDKQKINKNTDDLNIAINRPDLNDMHSPGTKFILFSSARRTFNKIDLKIH